MPPYIDAAYEHCRKVTRKAARNFYFAFVTLPHPKRRAIYATYAFCRLCDDIADEPLPPDEKVARLAQVHRDLDRAFGGEPDGPVFTALKDATDTFHIPREHLHELVRGVEMDLTQSRYHTFDDLRSYCYRVASAVGLICIEVFQYRDPKAREYAVDLGLAMQLTNILRDIQEDAGRGRIYIPQEEMTRFGYSEGELLSGIINENFIRLMQFQAQRARAYFDSGRHLLPLLAPRSRACPAVLHGLYQRLLDRIEARHYDVFHGRIGLSTWEKLTLTARVWAWSLFIPSAPKGVA